MDDEELPRGNGDADGAGSAGRRFGIDRSYAFWAVSRIECATGAPRCKRDRAYSYEPQIPHFVRDDNFFLVWGSRADAAI